MRLVIKAKVGGKRREYWTGGDFFSREQGLEDSNGKLLCPVCGCCSLTRLEGDEQLGFVCAGGCVIRNGNWYRHHEASERVLSGESI
jgi:hypothetical protein